MDAEHHGRVELGEAELHVRQAGEGPPVLFIHGGGCSSELWGECFERIAGFAHAIAYDQRSFGRSSGEPASGIARHGDDAAELLDRLGAAPATVLGHSFGATVALDLAARYPDRVSAMVLLEPTVDFRTFPSLGMLGLTAGIQLRRLRRGDHAAAHWFFKTVTSYRSRDANAFEGLPAELQQVCLANATSVVELFKYTPEASGRHLPEGGIGAIGCPVTCVIGTDSWPPAIRTTRAVARAIPRARLVEAAGASHVLPYDAPDTVVEAVRALVSAPAQQQRAGAAILPG